MFNLRIAFIAVVEDYHDFQYICSSIQGVDLSFRELGMDSGNYVGVIFDDEPTDSEVEGLLSEVEITLDAD